MSVALFPFDMGVLLLRFSKVMHLEMYLASPNIYKIGKYTCLLLWKAIHSVSAGVF